MKITIDLPAKRIADLMITAVEGNHMTQSWCAGVYLKSARPAGGDRDDPWYADSRLYEGDFTLEVHEIEDEGEPEETKAHTVTKADFEAGLKIIAEKYPHHITDILAENEDAVTADVFLQCVVLKGIVYG